jgi:hypothetical protein
MNLSPNHIRNSQVKIRAAILPFQVAIKKHNLSCSFRLTSKDTLYALWLRLPQLRGTRDLVMTRFSSSPGSELTRPSSYRQPRSRFLSRAELAKTFPSAKNCVQSFTFPSSNSPPSPRRELTTNISTTNAIDVENTEFRLVPFSNVFLVNRSQSTAAASYPRKLASGNERGSSSRV